MRKLARTYGPGMLVLFRPSEIISMIENACASQHAGGPGNKKKAASTSSQGTIESSGADGAAVAASGDDDGDGDADPDSDRRKKILLSKSPSPSPAPNQRATSNRVLRMSMLRDKVPLSRSTIYEAIKKGEFPAPISLFNNGRAVGWLESDIDAWLASRVTASKAA
jgi:prophage regulatory protein